MKKSNTSVFFIVGIIIVVFSLMFWNTRKNIDVEQDAKLVLDFQKEKESFEGYSNGCLKIATETTIERYGLDYVGKQIEYYISKQYLECMNNFEDYREKGFEITYEEPKVNFIANGNNIETELLAKLALKSGEQEVQFEKFSTRFQLPDNYKDPIIGEWLYRGILYNYEDRVAPRPMSVHIVKIDLEDPTIEFFVTPRIAPNVMTTSDFLNKYDVQLAINAGLYDIGGTNEVNGYSVSGGNIYSAQDIKPDVTFFISSDKKLSMQKKISDVEYAVTGQNRVVDDNKPSVRLDPNHPLHKDTYENLQPTTALGIDFKDNWLIMIVIDGRQPGFSEGIKLIELADIFLENKADIAINMDGGGSTTLVIQGKGVLNKPSIGSERPVANHLGIIAEPLK